MPTLTSPHNSQIKELRKAVRRGSTTRDGYAVAEGFHLLDEALRSRCEVAAVFATESAGAELAGRNLTSIPVNIVADALLRDVSATETSQGVVALVRPPDWKLEQLFSEPALVVILDQLQDPGNAGAVLRAAEAFGATGVIGLKGTVNVYNPKCLRASAGSVFRVPLVSGVEATAALAAVEERRLDLFALLSDAARPLGEVNFVRSCGLIVGSEAHGVSDSLRQRATGIRIPTAGVESLNAAVSAGIALYVARAQRTVTE